MRQFTLLIGHLADVMQQSCSLCLLGVQPEFACHHSAKIGRLACVLQQVLSVRRAILHLTNNSYQFGVQSMNAKVDGCAFSRLYDFVVELFLHLCHNFLDACRMDTTVAHQLVQSQATYLAADGVESRDYYCLWGVIDHYFHSACSLKSTDVSSLTADNASFHLIVIDMEHAYRVFYSRFCRCSLNGLYDNLLCLLVCIEFCLVHYLVDVRGGIGTCLILKTLNKAVLSLFCTKS